MSLWTERLIEHVKKHPILYDLGHEDYKNGRKKDKVWHEIGSQMNENGYELKRKWKNLKDSYAKHLKSINPKTRLDLKKNYRNWPWASLMEPIKPYMTYGKISSHASESEDDESQTPKKFFISEETTTETFFTKCESYSPEHEQTEPIPATTVHKISKRPDSAMNSFVSLNDAVNNQSLNLSPIELIFLGYARTIKTLSMKRQAITKLKVAQIIMEQELLHYKESSASCNLNQSSGSGTATIDNRMEPSENMEGC